MKSFLMVIALALTPLFAGDYGNSIPEAQKLAQKDGKLVLVEFGTTWCPGCKIFNKALETDPKLKPFISANAHLVKIDCDEEPELAGQYNVSAYPTFVLMDANLNVLNIFAGYKNYDMFSKSVKTTLLPTTTVAKLKEVSSIDYGDFKQYYLLAQILIQEKDINAAKDVFARLARLDPDEVHMEKMRNEPGFSISDTFFELTIFWEYSGMHYREHDKSRVNGDLYIEAFNNVRSLLPRIAPGERISILYNFAANVIDEKYDYPELDWVIEQGLKDGLMPMGLNIIEKNLALGVSLKEAKRRKSRMQNQHDWYRSGFITMKLERLGLYEAALAYKLFDMGDDWKLRFSNFNTLARYIFENYENLPDSFVQKGIDYATEGIEVAIKANQEKPSPRNETYIVQVVNTLAELQNVAGLHAEAVETIKTAFQYNYKDQAFLKKQLAKFEKALQDSKGE